MPSFLNHLRGGRNAHSSGSADNASYSDVKSGASSQRVIKTPAEDQVLDPAIDEGMSLPRYSGVLPVFERERDTSKYQKVQDTNSRQGMLRLTGPASVVDRSG